MPDKNDTSIIEIIDKMVREGESEEKIVKTLQDLGVSPDKAKKLLLLGQADTFSLLKGEIKKIVKTELDEEKPEMKKFIQTEALSSSDDLRGELTKAVISDLKQYERDITGQSKTFQEQIQSNMGKVNELNERVKVKLNELGEAVRDVQVDMDEMKVKGISGRNRIISNILWVLGLLFGLGAAYQITILLNQPSSIDSLILLTITALIAVTMLFVATVI